MVTPGRGVTVIQWPPGWEPDDGWPSPSGGNRPSSTVETRLWTYLSQVLRDRYDTNVAEQIARLGGPKARVMIRDLDEVRNRIRAYYIEHNGRPRQRTDPEWRALNDWLLTNHNLSIHRLCEELGLPGNTRRRRTMDEVRTQILTHYETHRERPVKTRSREWSKIESWLQTQGSSISRTCNDLGIPAAHNLNRTIEQVHDRIRSYFQVHGHRPSAGRPGEWNAINGWLGKRGSSLSRVCDELGLPRQHFDLRKVDTEQEIHDFRRREGRWPRRNDITPSGIPFRSLDLKLTHQGKPGLAATVRALHAQEFETTGVQRVRTAAMSYHQEHGEWPKNNGERLDEELTWYQADNLLRLKGSSVHSICVALGKKYRRKTVRLGRDEVLEAVAVHYRTCGHPPKDRERVGGDGLLWGSVRRQYGAEYEDLLAQATGMRRLRPLTMESVKEYIQAHRDRTGVWPGTESGHTPDGRNWRAIWSWLHVRGFSLCDLRIALGATSPPPPIDKHLAVRLLESYRARTGKWPHGGMTERIEGDGRTWGSVDRGLRPLGLSLSALKRELAAVYLKETA